MNERHIKNKKQSYLHTKPTTHLNIEKNPSATSVKLPQGHCQPKNQPQFNPQHAHPRRHDEK